MDEFFKNNSTRWFLIWPKNIPDRRKPENLGKSDIPQKRSPAELPAAEVLISKLLGFLTILNQQFDLGIPWLIWDSMRKN